MKSDRSHVAEILNIFYRTKLNLKSIQSQYFSNGKISNQDHIRTTVLSKEIIRWKGRLDWHIKKQLDAPFNKLQPKLLAILELASYELLFDEQVPDYAAINSSVDLAKEKFNKKTSGLVNAVLRKISKVDKLNQPKDMPDNDWYSFPKWLYQKWIDQKGKDKAQLLCNYYNSNIPLTIRRDSATIEHDIFTKQIEDNDIQITRVDNSENYYNITSGGGNLIASELFKKGKFSFQDRGAGAIVEMLDPQKYETILDVCCAPGTKTNYIAEIMENTGINYASDSNNDRLKLSMNDAKRLNNSNIIWELRDATKDTFPIADRILVDAPCTGTGVIGRRPDIKWRQNSSHIKEMVKIQKSILENICKYLKPNGVLVYATCSMEDEENWQVVNAFLKLHTEFKVASIVNQQLQNMIDDKNALQTFPPVNMVDGMFAVKMIRVK